tara:strand:+ start:441 stop:1028 length:588 start_codon:yes stop_codon:yes gene_type:complete
MAILKGVRKLSQAAKKAKIAKAAKDPSNIYKKIKAQVSDGRIKSANDISASDFALLRKSKEFKKQRDAVKGMNPTVMRAIRTGQKKSVDGVDVSLWGFLNRPTAASKAKVGSDIKVGKPATAKGKEIKSMKFTKDDLADIKQPVSPEKPKKAGGGLISRQQRGSGLDVNKRTTPKVGSSNRGRTGRFGTFDYRSK